MFYKTRPAETILSLRMQNLVPEDTEMPDAAAPTPTTLAIDEGH